MDFVKALSEMNLHHVLENICSNLTFDQMAR